MDRWAQPTEFRSTIVLGTPGARSESRCLRRNIRLSGEITDRAILDHLRSPFRQAGISHAFASTEAGVAFDVTDGKTGFPSSVISNTPGVEMKKENGSLRIRSKPTAFRYLRERSHLSKMTTVL